MDQVPGLVLTPSTGLYLSFSGEPPFSMLQDLIVASEATDANIQ